jgi:hypothetical protein
MADIIQNIGNNQPNPQQGQQGGTAPSQATPLFTPGQQQSGGSAAPTVNTGSGGPVTGAGSTGPAAPQAGPSAGPATGGNRQQGTGFTNIQKIVNANQGNQLGNVVTSGINNQINQGEQNLNNQVQQFTTQEQANAINPNNTGQLQGIINGITGNTYGGQSATPTSAQNSVFSNALNSSYGGPTSLANTQQLQQQTAQAQALAQLAGSTGGRQALLQNYVGGPNYNQGNQMLDTLLLGNQANTVLNQANQGANQLNTNVNNAINNATSTAAQQQQQAAANISQAQGLLNSGLANVTSQDQNAYNTALSALTGTGNNAPRPGEKAANTAGMGSALGFLNQQGVNVPTGVNLANVSNIGQYLTQSNVQSDPRYQALAALAGNPITGVTATASPYSLNTAALNSAIAALVPKVTPNTSVIGGPTNLASTVVGNGTTAIPGIANITGPANPNTPTLGMGTNSGTNVNPLASGGGSTPIGGSGGSFNFNPNTATATLQTAPTNPKATQVRRVQNI